MLLRSRVQAGQVPPERLSQVCPRTTHRTSKVPFRSTCSTSYLQRTHLTPSTPSTPHPISPPAAVPAPPWPVHQVTCPLSLRLPPSVSVPDWHNVSHPWPQGPRAPGQAANKPCQHLQQDPQSLLFLPPNRRSACHCPNPVPIFVHLVFRTPAVLSSSPVPTLQPNNSQPPEATPRGVDFKVQQGREISALDRPLL